MPQREHHNIQGDSSPDSDSVITSFDELTKGLATGAVSRRKVLKWMGGALVGAALASVPRVAWADDDRCSEGQTRCGDRCVNLQTNERHCGSCSNRCAWGQECVGGKCQCPSGATLCGGACVSSLCPQGGAFNTSTCQCEPCPPGTTICTSGEVPGLNVCCPLEGHIACCTVGVNGSTGGQSDAHTIGCVNSSCPDGCVIRATYPADLLGANAAVCSNECGPCVTDSGSLGCLSGGGPDPVQCVPL